MRTLLALLAVVLLSGTLAAAPTTTVSTGSAGCMGFPFAPGSYVACVPTSVSDGSQVQFQFHVTAEDEATEHGVVEGTILFKGAYRPFTGTLDPLLEGYGPYSATLRGTFTLNGNPASFTQTVALYRTAPTGRTGIRGWRTYVGPGTIAY